MVADEAEGGQGMTVRAAAKVLGISASALYGEFRKLETQEDASDLEA
jgi:transposase